MSNSALDPVHSRMDGDRNGRSRLCRGGVLAVLGVLLAIGPGAGIAAADPAPVLHADGTRLRWSPSGRDGLYRLIALGSSGRSTWKVQATAFTPLAVPGAAITYEVKAAHSESPWSNQVTISYPARSTTPHEKPSGSGEGTGTGSGESVEEVTVHGPLKVGLIGGLTGWGATAGETIRKATGVKYTRISPVAEGWGAGRELVSEGITPLVLYDPEMHGMSPAKVAEGVKSMLPTMRELGLTEIELGNEVYYHGSSAWEYAAQYRAAQEALTGSGVVLIADAWTDAQKPNGEWSQWEYGGGWCVLFVEALGHVPEAWSFHPYGPMSADGFGSGAHRQGWATVPRMLAYMKADHVYAPLNITEVGQPTYEGTDGNTPVSESEQAADVRQYLTQASEWGLASFYLYEGIDTGEGGYGLYKWPLKAKPSAAAFAETLAKLNG